MGLPMKSAIQSRCEQTSLTGDFSKKRSRPFYPPLLFNRSSVPISVDHKHLGFFLDSELIFLRHVKKAITKARKGIGVIRFMAKYVTSDVLDQMYKLYVRPHLGTDHYFFHGRVSWLGKKIICTREIAEINCLHQKCIWKKIVCRGKKICKFSVDGGEKFPVS